VQALPSSQLPLVRGVDVQVFVPLHESVAHVFGLLVHVMGVPAHTPPTPQVSLYVQGFPSSQLPLTRGVDVHVFVPLQDKVVHTFGLETQLIAVPWQAPPAVQVSL
jgi:hypothetical protein